MIYMIIKDLNIRTIFATNSKKTIEVDLKTNKASVRSSVPIGTSRGKHEVNYLPVDQVIKDFSKIKSQLLSKEFSVQEEFDMFLKKLDGTNNFSIIGGNLSLALSAAFLKALAEESNSEVFEYLMKNKSKMPLPLANVVGAKGLQTIEEYLLFPKKQKTFFDSVDVLSEVHTNVGKMLKEADSSFNFGKDLESAWMCSLNPEKILDILSGIAKENNLSIGLDMASSELWDGNKYSYTDGREMKKEEQLDFVKQLIENYDLRYVEDPFEEDDFDSFGLLLKSCNQSMICGDDLLTTNMERLTKAVNEKSVNAVIVKPNQIGTITDTVDFVKEAKKNNITTIMSHRSGETEDVLICHLAVGLGCDYVKFGIGGERLVKLNEMIRVEEIN